MGLFSKSKSVSDPILVIVHIGRSPRPKGIHLVKTEDQLEGIKRKYETEFETQLDLIRGFQSGSAGVHWDYKEIEG